MIFRQLVCWLVFGAMSVAGCSRPETTASARPAALRKVVLQTDWFPQAEHGGFYQALAKGFYADVGLDVEILPGGVGAGGIKVKVAKGDADFGMNRSDDVILAASRDLPLIMVAAVLQHEPQALLVHADSPVKTLADLEGRTVTAALGMAWIPQLQKKFGIKFALKPTNYSLAPFLVDKEAIQQCLVTSEPYFAAEHGVKVRTLPLAEAGIDSYHTIFCRRELVRTDPEKVRAFVAASIRGWRDYLEGDPAPANRLILERNPQMTAGLIAFSRGELISRALVRGDPANDEDIGKLSVARIERQIAMLAELKILEVPVKVETVVTREFLPSGSR